MENNPLVTVNILSYNRKDELRNTLSRVYGQDYKNIEVIVVDNASTDGTREMVRTEYPDAVLIEMQKNVGIAGWNEGFKIAKGEYVMVLDDDSYPDVHTIQKGFEEFANNDRIGIVAFEIYNNRINSSETKDFMSKPYFFVGCGALIKIEVLRNVGYFNDHYFIYLHELDYSARCYNHGYEIKYLPSARVYHNQNLLSRGRIDQDPFRSGYRYKHYFISYSIFLIENFTFKRSLFYLIKWVANRSIVTLRYFYFRELFASLIHLIGNFSRYVSRRSILSESVQKIYNNGNIPLVDPDFFKKKL